MFKCRPAESGKTRPDYAAKLPQSAGDSRPSATAAGQLPQDQPLALRMPGGRFSVPGSRHPNVQNLGFQMWTGGR